MSEFFNILVLSRKLNTHLLQYHCDRDIGASGEAVLIASVWASKDSTVTNAVAEDNYLARTFQRKFLDKKCPALGSSLLFSKLPQSNPFKIRIISTIPYLLDKTHKLFPPSIPKENCKPSLIGEMNIPQHFSASQFAAHPQELPS